MARRPLIVSRPWVVPLLAVLLGVINAGCGGGGHARPAVAEVTPPRVVDVYSSLPLQGPDSAQATAVLNGIELALWGSGGHAGPWTVAFQSLDDTVGSVTGWDPARTAANARRVALDPLAVAYIGELNPEAMEVSLPLLNQVGVPQIAPAVGYVGLTRAAVGAQPGDPARLYPTGHRTLVRLGPDDAAQAQADLAAMQAAGCRGLTVAHDASVTGTEFAALLGADSARFHLPVLGDFALPLSPVGFESYVAGLPGAHARCVFMAAAPSQTVVQTVAQMHTALPRARVFGSDGTCLSPFADLAQSSPALTGAALVECALPVPRLSATAAGRRFLALYRARYGSSAPDLYAVYGYEAMTLTLRAIASLRTRGNQRAAVLRALRGGMASANAAFGRVAFDGVGDDVLRQFALYRVDGQGQLGYVHAAARPPGGAAPAKRR